MEFFESMKKYPIANRKRFRNRKLRVVIAAEIGPPEIGGPVTFVERLIASSAEANQLQISIVTLSESGQKLAWDSNLLCENIAVKRLPWHTLTVRAYADSLRKLVLDGTADVIFAQGTVVSGLPSLVVSRSLRVPYVVRCPGNFAWERTQRKVGAVASPSEQRRYVSSEALLERIQRSVVSNAARVIVPCEYLREEVCKWGAKRELVRVVHNAVSGIVEFPEAGSMDCIARKRQIVFAGRFVPWKGLDRILESFEEVLKSCEGARLLLFGDGPMRNQVEQLIVERSLARSVSLLGIVAKDRLRKMLLESRALILSSSYECCSNIVLESLAVGTPVVAPAIPGLSMFSRDSVIRYSVGNNAELIKEALKLLVSDLDFGRASVAARGEASRFSGHQAMERVLSTLHGATQASVGLT